MAGSTWIRSRSACRVICTIIRKIARPLAPDNGRNTPACRAQAACARVAARGAAPARPSWGRRCRPPGRVFADRIAKPFVQPSCSSSTRRPARARVRRPSRAGEPHRHREHDEIGDRQVRRPTSATATASTPATSSTTTTATELQVRHHRELGDHDDQRHRRDRGPASPPRPSWGRQCLATTRAVQAGRLRPAARPGR
jgi:hypothetical protein